MSVFLKEKFILLLFIKVDFLEWQIIKFLIQWNKFGLIWSYILKDMNFLIFRYFFWIFLNFLNLKSIYLI